MGIARDESRKFFRILVEGRGEGRGYLGSGDRVIGKTKRLTADDRGIRGREKSGDRQTRKPATEKGRKRNLGGGGWTRT